MTLVVGNSANSLGGECEPHERALEPHAGVIRDAVGGDADHGAAEDARAHGGVRTAPLDLKFDVGTWEEAAARLEECACRGDVDHGHGVTGSDPREGDVVAGRDRPRRRPALVQ